MGFLAGKRVLIVGLASNRSIAYGIAKAMHREGAELAFTYQNEKLKDRVTKMAAEFNSSIIMPCDVASDNEIAAVFETLKQSWDKLDSIIHSVAFAPGEELKGAYLENATREGFLTAHEISSYSFSALAKAGKDMLSENGSMLTLSYLGAVRSMPNYNVMGLAKASLEANVRFMAYSLGEKGIRVNGISAGPIRTLAASGIADFKSMLDYVKNRTPLKRNVTTDEVGNTAAFLCSDLASGITGEITYVDCGFSTTAM
ncbi:enoyl-ACP reductase [Candidatus Albibeggiatoa sp. nov. BB20]|uniref:enoyl-ACP reductase FabI n=1 Tax=Candidatus Albibeggiatoa sp. nov. BB20 TaxID=3162723 RepID=UPI0033654A57